MLAEAGEVARPGAAGVDRRGDAALAAVLPRGRSVDFGRTKPMAHVASSRAKRRDPSAGDFGRTNPIGGLASPPPEQNEPNAKRPMISAGALAQAADCGHSSCRCATAG